MGSSEDRRSSTKAGPSEEFGLTIGRLEQEKRSQTDSTGSPEVMGSSEDRRSTKAGPPSEDRRSTKAGPPDEFGLTIGRQEQEQRIQTGSTGPSEETGSSEEDRSSTKAGPPE